MKKIVKKSGLAAVIVTIAVCAGFPAARASYDAYPDLSAAALRYQVTAKRKLDLHYSVYAGGFEALHATLVMRLDKNAYDLKVSAATQGLIGDLFPWRASYITTGHADAGRLVPAVYTARSTWRKNEKITEMDYGPNGKILKSTTQDGEKTTVRRDFKTKLTQHTLDMLTGVLAMLQSVRNTNRCAGAFPVFDGKRRFNIVLKDDGREMLQPTSYSNYKGMALRCTLTVRPVAGFSAEDQKRGWLAVQNHTEARHMPPTLWLGRLKGSGQVVPVKMEIASEYGAVVAHLSGAADN
ncbi:MAG: DUF3108 domain-containing protein [Alphaproteobacteria bacterium]|nr:DUF3108 domain-containing protein [Alphaproteobacteria bacterium]MDE2337143.1 DUF3108 domain-containing protein [Alphaproteobacteria bacterium]